MYHLRPASDDDYEFLYTLNVRTMRTYVDQTWGWDDEAQQEYFRSKFDPAAINVIVVDGCDVGALDVEESSCEVRLKLIEILPEFQRRGIGSVIVRDLLAKARESNRPMTLQVLKVNPARKLYERTGFVVCGETETHYQMRAAAESAD